MIGEFKSTLDAKGRMNIPVKLREELGNSFVISKTIGNPCIKVYSQKDWNDLVEKITSMPSVQTQTIQRFLFGSAFEVTVDKQGRVSVPAALREYAKLSADVVVVGLGKNSEIWDKSEWNAFNEVTNSEDLLEQAISLGI